MAAYAAVISLKSTIERIRESSIFSLVPLSEKIIIPVFKELKSLQKVLKRLDDSSVSKSRKRVNALDEKIKDVVWKFEDALESHLTDQIISQSESSRAHLKLARNIVRKIKNKKKKKKLFSIDLEGLRHDVVAFINMVKKLKAEYIHELNNLPEEEEDEDEESIISTRNDFGGAKSKMVGLSDIFEEVKRRLTRTRGDVALVGMAGIGKSTLAREVFEDPLISSHFKHRVWIKVGRKSQFIDIRRLILAQVDPIDYKTTQHRDYISIQHLKKRLKGENCLVVLDDVWVENALFGKDSCIQILLTCRERIFATWINRSRDDRIQVMRFLNEDESKDLLCEKVFGGKDFPPQLEKAGKKIAHNCDGLPLMIVTIADYLSKAEKTPEFWNEVAQRRNSVFEVAYNDISKVLFPTYDYLPQYLKMLFLYLGAFPRDYEIPRSRLVNIVAAEGFLDCIRETTELPSYLVGFYCRREDTEDFLIIYLNELDMWRNIVITNQKSRWWFIEIDYAIKTCHLHSSWQHLCKVEARKNKFFHILSSRVDGVEGQRRLCVHFNNIVCINEAYNSVNCASNARSLLCSGPYHKYPVPIDVGFKLLRVLDALKVRFYQFPIEILKLVHLQYLSLTCNKELPASLSKLFNLQFLIIHPHLNIKSSGAPLLLSIQIWDMQELKHIEIMGSCLQDPPYVASLEKLFTLLGVSASSCTREVFEKIPNIRKLGIRVERLPNDDGNPFSCFHHISQLENLITLKCAIVNPIFEPEFIVPVMTPIPLFPPSLKKLHLSGLCYPWECMNVIGSLPNLQVLKLRCYAFRGPRWEAEKGIFLKLEFLLIQDTDLVKWEPKPGSFRMLSHLVMKNCYKLKELIWPKTVFVGTIELVDCHPLANTFVKQPKWGPKPEIVASFGNGELKR